VGGLFLANENDKLEAHFEFESEKESFDKKEEREREKKKTVLSYYLVRYIRTYVYIKIVT